MALLKENLSQLEVESVDIEDKVAAAKQDSKLETLISGTGTRCCCCSTYYNGYKCPN